MNSAARKIHPPSASVPDASWKPLAGGTGFVRSGWAEAFASSQLRTVDDFLAATGEALSKPGLGSRYRARLRIAQGGRACVVYLKRFGQEKFWTRFRRWCEDHRWLSSAEREAGAAEALLLEELPVASVLAWGVQEQAGTTTSFVVLNEVPGLPAHRWVEQLSPGPDAWLAKRALVRALAPLSARFHRLGWRHRDFYLCHWFVASNESGLRLSLIDLQRIFRPRWRATRWLVKDLAQINYSATPGLFSHAMRMRFVHAYFGTTHLNSGQKRLVKQVLRKTHAIARHDQRRAC